MHFNNCIFTPPTLITFNVFDIIFYIFLSCVSLNYLLLILLHLSFNSPTSFIHG